MKLSGLQTPALILDVDTQKIKAVVSFLADHGIAVKTVSGRSTGTAEIKAAEGLYTEL